MYGDEILFDVETVTVDNCKTDSCPIKIGEQKKVIRKKPATQNLVKKQISHYKFRKGKTDKRVSLNVAPLKFNSNGEFNPANEPFVKRIAYVLGSSYGRLGNGQNIWGFLNSCLSKSCGLIFPYTPNISISHTVNYETSEIVHSNLSYNHYKNTPPPTISLDATFTADTRDNALHMLSALWFLRAVTKCDFGEHAVERGVAGMPPPVLYLNGYNQIMDNIPVVVKSFSYTLPQDKDYVELGINLDSKTQAFNDSKLYSGVNGQFFDNYDGSLDGEEGMKYINGVAASIESLTSGVTTYPSNRYNYAYFNNWLPTEMTFNITLAIQPNLLKYKKQFDLDYYKMGVYNMDSWKGGKTLKIVTKSGVDDCKYESLSLTFKSRNKAGIINDMENSIYNARKKAYEKNNQTYIGKKPAPLNQTLVPEITTKYVLTKDEMTQLKNNVNIGSIDTHSKTYKFDRSGFTW